MTTAAEDTRALAVTSQTQMLQNLRQSEVL